MNHSLIMDQAAKLVETEMLANQTMLVNECFTAGIFGLGDIVNQYKYYDRKGNVIKGDTLIKAQANDNFYDIHSEEEVEIYSWYAVTDWFADYLEKYGAPILHNKFGIWWGRTTFGQMIYLDYIIQQIAEEIYRE